VFAHGVIVSSRCVLPTAVEPAADADVLVPDVPPTAGATLRGRSISRRSPTRSMESARAAGHERVSLVGNSFGAQVAVSAALRHLDRVERIALLGPTADPAVRSVLRQYLRWQRSAADEDLSCIPVMARDLVDVAARASRAWCASWSRTLSTRSCHA
jgi:pimeloyl-ACP methyl ester carboxylesterase